MEPHGQSPWYLFDIPSYACLREAASAKAGQGFGGLSTSSGIHRSIDALAHECFTIAPRIHPWVEPVVFCVGG